MKAKIIRVPGIELSERLANECVVQAKKFGIDAELFDGINGLEYQQHLDKLEIRPLKKFKKGRPGVFGCFLSHYYIWLECADQTEPYLVLEHDGYIQQALPADILDQFDYILKLDSIYPHSKTYENELARQDKNNLVIQTIDCNEDMKNSAGYYSGGTYGYIIKPAAAKLLIAWIKEHGFLPSDHQLGLDICDIKQVVPSIVRLHPYFYTDQCNHKSNSLTINTDLLNRASEY
jgi:GR25 family glycosyltransferase involved in LPS biosynthesis